MSSQFLILGFLMNSKEKKKQSNKINLYFLYDKTHNGSYAKQHLILTNKKKTTELNIRNCWFIN